MRPVDLGATGRTHGDPLWNSVVLLTRLNGANNSNTFTDLSGRHTLSPRNSAVIATSGVNLASAVGENSALSCTGSLSTQTYLDVAGNVADWNFAGKNLTFEFFGYYQPGLLGVMGSSRTSTLGWEWTVDAGSGTMTLVEHDTILDGWGATRAGGPFPTLEMHHYAISIDGSGGYAHFDGVYANGVAIGGVPNYRADKDISIAFAPNGPYWWFGRMQEVRCTITGAAAPRYPRSNIVRPISHFPAYYQP